jgi:hypothetical protein
MAQVSVEVEARMTTTRKLKAKNLTDAEKAMRDAQKGTMKWLPFMSSFVIERMCALIKSGIRTDKGFKEVHLTAMAKAVMEHCGADVLSTQVYNHLRKGRLRWLTVSRLCELSAQWCEDNKCIILEAEHYRGHVAVSTLSTTPTAIIPYLHK